MYVARHSSYSHQEEAGKLLLDKKAFALFLDMGTGKTKIIIDEFSNECEKVDGLTDLLIVAPAGSYSNWVTELQEHIDPKLYEQLVIAKWKSSGNSVSAATKAIKNLLSVSDRPRVLIMNVEALSSVKEARMVCLMFLDANKSTVVVDESTSLKNGKAKRTMFLVNHVAWRARRRRILSGLPSPNSPLDIYSQFEFLDPKILGFPTFRAFTGRYAITKKHLFPGARFATEIVIGFKDIEHLGEQIKPFSYRKTKDECLDLPAKIYMEPRVVELTEQQRKAYAEIKDRSTTELSKDVHVTASLVITKMLRLHQVLCGHVMDEDGVVREVPTNRLKALIEILDDHQGKAIIWANYNHSINAVAKLLKEKFGEAAVAVFYGGNKSTRLDDEQRWKTNPACRFLVASQGAGSLGNTWVEADLVIYYSNDFSLEHRMQSEDRSHRAGQKKSVTYIDLMTPRTVDQKIITALRKKINLSSVITGDNYKEWLI